MAIDEYLSTIESYKQNKQTRTKTDYILTVPDGQWAVGLVKKVKGLRSTSWLLHHGHEDV